VSYVVAAAVAAVCCVFVAWRWALQVASVAQRDWESDLAHELAAARSDDERIVLVNDALDDVEHELTAGDRVPKLTAWIALFGSALALVAGALRGPDPRLLGCVAIAVAGASACLLAGRTARRSAAKQRERIDALIAAMVGDLYRSGADTPQRRSRRRRRR
jgi:Flp pilus assembly protein TadB